MTKAPFEEPLVPGDTTNPAVIAARQRLQAVLDKLDPAGGILDGGAAPVVTQAGWCTVRRRIRVSNLPHTLTS